MLDYRKTVERAAEEMKAAAGGVDPAEIAALAKEIAKARKIVLHGVGREGLMMRALAMRLYHMGLDAHVAGDMSAPPVGRGDLLIVSAGPGHFPTILALATIASRSGARTACITAQPKGRVPRVCDTIVGIPAQTMADDTQPKSASVLPMGSLFEGAQYLAFEVLILLLRGQMKVSPAAMRKRHTNLE